MGAAAKSCDYTQQKEMILLCILQRALKILILVPLVNWSLKEFAEIDQSPSLILAFLTTTFFSPTLKTAPPLGLERACQDGREQEELG